MLPRGQAFGDVFDCYRGGECTAGASWAEVRCAAEHLTNPPPSKELTCPPVSSPKVEKRCSRRTAFMKVEKDSWSDLGGYPSWVSRSL